MPSSLRGQEDHQTSGKVTVDKSCAVIIGVGDGLSASLARELATDHDLTLAARSGEKMREVATETGAETILLDATDEAAVGALFDALPQPRGSSSTIPPLASAGRWRSSTSKTCGARWRLPLLERSWRESTPHGGCSRPNPSMDAAARSSSLAHPPA